MSASLLHVPTTKLKKRQPGNYFHSCERTMKNIKHLQKVYSLNKYEFSLWNQYPQGRVISPFILNGYKNITFFLVKDKG